MRITATILFSLLTLSASAAQKNGGVPSERRIDITSVAISSDGADAVVTFEAAVGKKAAKGTRAITVTPVLTGGGERHELPAITVRGRGSRISQARRDRASGTRSSGEGVVIYLRNGESYSYAASLPDSLLTPDSRLIFESGAVVCCSTGDNIRTGATDFVEERAEVVIPELPGKSTGDRISSNYGFVEPMPEGPVRFTDAIRDNALVVYFELDRHDLKKEYRNNRNILHQIIAAINVLTRSEDSEIAAVMLAGFASPEGTIGRNRELGERRGLALRDYITTNTRLRADDFVMHNGGADWDGLRIMVMDSDMPYRSEILGIIDHTPEWDAATGTARMDVIKKISGGKAYEILRRDFFPELRNTAYIKVYYRNKDTGK